MSDTPVLNIDGPQFTDPACRDVDPALFFPVSERDPNGVWICRECADRNPCLQWALTHKEEGIWGGTTAAERQRLRGA